MDPNVNILHKVLNECNIREEDLTKRVGLVWDDFVVSLTRGEAPRYQSIRTIREKWQLMIFAGYFIPIEGEKKMVVLNGKQIRMAFACEKLDKGESR